MKSFSLHGNEMSNSRLNSQAFIKKQVIKSVVVASTREKEKKHFTNLVYFSDASSFTKIRCGVLIRFNYDAFSCIYFCKRDKNNDIMSNSDANC